MLLLTSSTLKDKTMLTWDMLAWASVFQHSIMYVGMLKILLQDSHFKTSQQETARDSAFHQLTSAYLASYSRLNLLVTVVI